jgi:hypothetical protein
MIRFWCECGRQLQAAESFIGQSAACPMCQRTTIVPSSDQPKPGAARSEITQRAEDSPRPSRAPSHRQREPASPQPASGWATASFLLGLLSFPCLLGLLAGIPALIAGVIALRDRRVRAGELTGKGNAIAGIVLGCLGLLLVAPLYLFTVEVILTAERHKEEMNLKLIGMRLHGYHDVNNSFPAANAYHTKDGKPGLSWRVALLPFLEEDNLFKQFRLDEPWDSPHNLALLPRMPKTYLHSSQSDPTTGMTHYQVFVGPGTVFEDMKDRNPFAFPGAPRRGIRITDITDGTSNTILVATAKTPVPWTKPDDMPFDPNLPLPPLNDRFRGSTVLLCDGSNVFLPKNVPQQTLRAMITRNDGLVVQFR